MQSTPEPHDRPRRFCLVFARGGGGQLQTIPLIPAFARSTYGFAARDRADLLPSVSVERLRRRSFGQQVEASNVAKPQTGHTRANLSRASALVWPRLRGHACARATLAALKAGRAQVEEKLRELGREDPIRTVTGTSALDAAIERTEAILRTLGSMRSLGDDADRV